MQRFAGKVAIVTGASSGMGLATAHQLAAEGAKVIMASNDQAALDAAVADVQARSGTAHAVFADVCSDADNKRMADTAVEQFGGLNAAFINAGIVTDVTLSQVTDEAFDKIFHTNSKSVAFALKHFLPAIEKSGGKGSVVVNSSVASRTVCTEAMGVVLYAASKAANNMMTQYASMEAAAHGTRVNAIAPGSVVTNLLGADKGRDFWQELAGSKHALKRVAAPEEIAKFVCFLLSDEASFITGSVHPIDGGSEHLL